MQQKNAKLCTLKMKIIQNHCFVLAQQPANNFALAHLQPCGTSPDCSRRGEFEKKSVLLRRNLCKLTKFTRFWPIRSDYVRITRVKHYAAFNPKLCVIMRTKNTF